MNERCVAAAAAIVGGKNASGPYQQLSARANANAKLLDAGLSTIVENGSDLRVEVVLRCKLKLFREDLARYKATLSPPSGRWPSHVTTP